MADFEPTSDRPRMEPVAMEVYLRLRQELLGLPVPHEREVLNIERTWAHNPALMKAQYPLQMHLNHHNSMPPRHRELVVLRVGWNCRSEYEFAQHTIFGRRAGLTNDEIRRVIAGPDAAGWSEDEAVVLRATDQLLESKTLSARMWGQMMARYTTEQMLDFLSLVGRYWTVSVVLNSIGVTLEDDRTGFPTG